MSNLEKYEFNFTMGKYLEIQRKTGTNLFAPDEKKEWDLSISTLRKKSNEWDLLLITLKDKIDENEKFILEKLEKNEITLIQNMKNELELLQNANLNAYRLYMFKMMIYFCEDKSIENDANITIDDLNEFTDMYDQAHTTIFNIKSDSSEEESTGK